MSWARLLANREFDYDGFETISGVPY